MSEAEIHRTQPISQTSNPTGKSPFITFPVFAAGLAILVFLSFAPVLLGWRSFFTRDFSNFGYPIAFYVQQSYQAGEIPWWNPYNLMGLPFVAQWNTLACYPLSLIYILLPLPWSLNLFNLAHLYGGGLGMYCLLRRWLQDDRAAALAGIGYAFGGLLVSSLMWPNNSAALGWFPWVLLAGEQAALAGGRHRILAAFVLALQLLAGSPEITVLAWAMTLLIACLGQYPGSLSIFKRVLPRLGLAMLLALGLAAIQLLPFLELVARSHRHADYAGPDWSLSWSGLGNFFVPWFHTVRDRDGILFQLGQQWVTSHYPGAPILFLAALGCLSNYSRRKLLLILLSLGSLLLALGPHGWIYTAVREVMPIFGFMRYPIKFIVVLAVVLPILAAYGVHEWFERDLKPGWTRRTLMLVLLAIALVTALSQWQPAAGENRWMTLKSGLGRMIIVLAIGGLLAAGNRFAWPRNGWLLPSCLGILLYADLILSNRHINPVVHPELLAGKSLSLEPHPALGQARVMVSPRGHELLDSTVFSTPEASVQIPRRALILNANLLEGLPKLDGFFSLYLPHPLQIVRRLSQPPDGLLDFLSVSHISRPDAPWEWIRRPNWLPWMTLVEHAVFADDQATLENLFATDFNPSQQVFLPLEAKHAYEMDRFTAQTKAASESRRIGPSAVLVTEAFRPHYLRANVEAAQPTWLVIAQADYPGWRATLDERPARIWKANYAFQALRVPPGRHQIELRYRPGSFPLGALISILTLLACLTYFIWSGSTLRRGLFGGRVRQSSAWRKREFSGHS